VTEPAAFHALTSSKISSNTLSGLLNSCRKMCPLRSFQILRCTKMVMVSQSLRTTLGAAPLGCSHHSSVVWKSSLGIGKSALVHSRNLSQTYPEKRQWTNSGTGGRSPRCWLDINCRCCCEATPYLPNCPPSSSAYAPLAT
jgi:hypothetical protein